MTTNFSVGSGSASVTVVAGVLVTPMSWLDIVQPDRKIIRIRLIVKANRRVRLIKNSITHILSHMLREECAGGDR